MKSLFLFLMALPVAATAALPFETAIVGTGGVGSAYSAEAMVEAGRESTLAAQVSGRILYMGVDAGDAVRQGQVLARIDDREARDAVAGNTAQVVQAEANLANAKAQYERARQLVARKFMSPASLDKAQAEFEAAQAQLNAARAGFSQASTARGYATIVAPFAGIVSTRQMQAGEMASLGKPLLTVFDPSTLRVTASVPETKVESLRQRNRLTIEFPALQKTLTSSAITILPASDTQTHVVTVRIALPERPPGIYPGMFARVSIDSAQAPESIRVPIRAIVRRSEVTAVYVVQGDRVELRQIRPGTEAAGYLEVLAGLERGERIALDPTKAGLYLKSLQRRD